MKRLLLFLLFISTISWAQTDRPVIRSIQSKNENATTIYGKSQTGYAFYDSDSLSWMFKNGSNWMRLSNLGISGSLPSNVLRSNYVNALAGDTKIQGIYKFDLENTNGSYDTAWSFLRMRNNLFYAGTYMHDQSLGDDAWGRAALRMKANYGGSLGQPNIIQLTTYGNYTSDSTLLEINDVEPTIRFYSSHVNQDIFRFDPNNAQIASPYFSWGNGTGFIDNTGISNGANAWTFPSHDGTFATDDQIAGHSISSTLQSPGSGQAGYTITWDNTNHELTLSPGSGSMGGSSGSTDNRITRADGTGGSTIQNSPIGISDSGNILDNNGNTIIGLTPQSSAGNYIDISNALTDPIIEAKGSSTSIEILMKPKGFAYTLGLYNGAGDNVLHMGPGQIYNFKDPLWIVGGTTTNTHAGDVILQGGQTQTGSGGDIRLMGGVYSTSGKKGNIQIGGISLLYSTWQNMEGGIFINNADHVPTGNPSGGGFLYVENGALKYRGSSGTTTTLGNP